MFARSAARAGSAALVAARGVGSGARAAGTASRAAASRAASPLALPATVTGRRLGAAMLGLASASGAACLAVSADASPEAAPAVTATSPAAPADAAAGAAAGRKPKVVFVLGGPGAGKGTQCANLVAEYGFVHLSAGDLLRAERASGSPDGAMIEEYIREGKIVPVEVTVRLLKRAMDKAGSSRFLIDGFPRNHDNVKGWERVIGDSAEVAMVLFFDTSEETMQARLLERGKSSGRSDDNIASIKKRFKTFHDSTMPVVEHYAAKGIVRRVCSSAPIEEVLVDTKRVVEPLVQAEVLEANQTLLDAIGSGDTRTYKALVAEDVSCSEGESNGLFVDGHRFHDFYMAKGGSNGAGGAGACVNTMSAPRVRLLGPDAAVVTYVRLVQSGEGGDARAFAETRVWSSRGSGWWQNVHFHRSPVGAAWPPMM